MSTASRIQPASAPVVYPDSDGEPMADSTQQWKWIALLTQGLHLVFAARRHKVHIGSNLLWYPVKGDARTRSAPDVMVVFGRPQDPDRRSWLQWEEDGCGPAVCIEVRSHGNTDEQLEQRRIFCERFGVDEFWIVDPEPGVPDPVLSWHRRGDVLVERLEQEAWHSELLGIHFELEGHQLTVFGPDGKRFINHAQQSKRADQADQRAEKERQRAERLASKLRELGVDPDSLTSGDD